MNLFHLEQSMTDPDSFLHKFAENIHVPQKMKMINIAYPIAFPVFAITHLRKYADAQRWVNLLGLVI